MRYAKEHKEETRDRIVGQASERFRCDGLAAVGVRALMTEAGLTHGGFYGYFRSRDELVSAAVESALQGTYASLSAAVANVPVGGELDAFIDEYLSSAHHDHPEQGCAGVALAPEIAREDDATRAAFSIGIERIVSLLANQLPGGGTTKGRYARAHSVFSLMLGAMQLARTQHDRVHSSSILEQARYSARLLANTVSDDDPHDRQHDQKDGGVKAR